MGGNSPNGFETLGKYDLNNDGDIDSEDAVFTSLQLWQDLNQDGQSQAEELTQLGESGIKSIRRYGWATNSSTSDTDAGNFISHTARYERTDGSEGENSRYLVSDRHQWC